MLLGIDELLVCCAVDGFLHWSTELELAIVFRTVATTVSSVVGPCI
jgi:hypothetical protein